MAKHKEGKNKGVNHWLNFTSQNFNNEADTINTVKSGFNKFITKGIPTYGEAKFYQDVFNKKFSSGQATNFLAQELANYYSQNNIRLA